MKTEDKAAEVTLQQCRNDVASRYGYQQWENVSFYEIDERLEVTSPPYAKSRLTDEVAELYASQVSASKDREIQLMTEERQLHAEECKKLQDVVTRLGTENIAHERTISNQSKTIEELKKALQIAKNSLDTYGEHPIIDMAINKALNS